MRPTPSTGLDLDVLLSVQLDTKPTTSPDGAGSYSGHLEPRSQVPTQNLTGNLSPLYNSNSLGIVTFRIS